MTLDGLQVMIVVNPDHTHTLDLFITNGIVSSKIEDKRDDFKFGIVNFLFIDGDLPPYLPYGVCISQFIRFV